MDLGSIIYLLPELILLLAAAVVFGLDLVWYRRRSPGAGSDPLAYVALAGLGLAALGLLPSLGMTTQVAGMIAVDPFAFFFKALALAGVALVILTAIPFMRTRTPYAGEFYGFLLIATLAICLAVSATNLILIYLSMEFLSITSYILAGYLRNDRRSGEAALKYFLYGATASGIMLYGMSLLYGGTGSVQLGGIAAALDSRTPDQMLWLAIPAMILMVAGFGFKASLVPFHQWAPDTYQGAPTPITAFLSTASKATGFAILIRVFFGAFGSPELRDEWVVLLTAIAILTMTIGNLAAIKQSNIKRLLAYSSIAQAGYILIGVAAVLAEPENTFNGLNGVLIYLMAYLFTNVGAFAVVIAIEASTGRTDLKDYSGLARTSPWLAGLLTFFLLSLAGIPPTGGFIGKFFVFGAAVQSQMWLLLLAAAVNSVIAAFYYLNVVRYMFLMPADEPAAPERVARPLALALCITAVATLLLGILPGPLIRWASQSAQALVASLR